MRTSRYKRLFDATLVAPTAIALGIVSAYAAPAATQLPGAGHVIMGSAEATTAGNTMNVGVSSNTVIDWGKSGAAATINAAGTPGFNIGSNAVVNFKGGNVLNIDRSGNPSQIYGTLRGSNNVFVANGNGITTGPAAQVSAGGIVGLIAGPVAHGGDTFDGSPASIGYGASGTVQLDGGSVTAPTIYLAGTDVVNVGAAVSATGDLTINGPATNQAPGTLSAGGTLTVTGPLAVNSGTVGADDAALDGGLSNAGNVTVQTDLNAQAGISNLAGGVLTVGGTLASGGSAGDAALQNAAGATLSAATITTTQGALINNSTTRNTSDPNGSFYGMRTGTIRMTGAGSQLVNTGMLTAAAVSAAGGIDNAGNLTASSDITAGPDSTGVALSNSGMLTSQGLTADGDFTNTGWTFLPSVNANATVTGALTNSGTVMTYGDMTVDGGVQNSGQLSAFGTLRASNASGPAIVNISPTFFSRLTAGAITTGPGVFDNRGFALVYGNVTANGGLDNSGTLSASTVTTGGQVPTTHGVSLLNSGELFTTYNLTTNNQLENLTGGLIQIGGDLIANGPVSNAGSLSANNATIHSNLNNIGNATMNGSVTATKGAITNSGTLTASSITATRGITNTASGTLTATADITASQGGTGPALNNAGMLTSPRLDITGTFTNTGDTNVSNPYGPAVTNVSGLFRNSGTFTTGGDVTSTGGVNNSGTMDVGGTLSASNRAGAALVNTGLAADGGGLTAGAITTSRGVFYNQGTATVGGNVNAFGGLHNGTSGTLSADAMTVTGVAASGFWGNRYALWNQGALSTNVGLTADSLSNSGGLVVGGQLGVAGNVLNVQRGAISADSASIGGSLTNWAGGGFSTNGDLGVGAGIVNSGGFGGVTTPITVGGTLTVKNARGRNSIDNSLGGTITANRINSTQGNVSDVLATITTTQGLYVTGGTLRRLWGTINGPIHSN